MKHLSRRRKRNQIEIGLVKAIEHPTEQTESSSEEFEEMWSFGLIYFLTDELEVPWNGAPERVIAP